MNNDLVTIITPSYNTAKFVLETIESVVAQTYPYWEMIIVDDCSTDNSVEIIENYIQKNNENRIRLFINQKNSGAALSRNRALREAKGRWIAFLDSDDLWLPEKIEKQIEFMESSNYSFSYTKYEIINENSFSLFQVVSGPKRITKAGMYLYCWPGCLTVMYDASVVGLVQIDDISKNNDYAMWLRVVEIVDCYLLPKCYSRYRKRSGSISNYSKVKLIKNHYRLFHETSDFSRLLSLIITIANLIFGTIKKIFYVKKLN